MGVGGGVVGLALFFAACFWNFRRTHVLLWKVLALLANKNTSTENTARLDFTNVFLANRRRTSSRTTSCWQVP